MSENDRRQRRIVERRMWRKIKKNTLYTIKILSLWLLCAASVFITAVVFRRAEPPDTWFWIGFEAFITVLAAVVPALQVFEYTEKTKRGGRIERENSRIFSRHKNS